MQKRTRIKSPIFSVKADGTTIKRGQVKISTHARIKQLVRELGGELVLRDIRWENLCKKVSLG